MDEDKILEKLKNRIEERKRPKPQVRQGVSIVDKVLDFLQTRRRDLLEAPMIAAEAQRNHQDYVKNRDVQVLLDKTKSEAFDPYV